MSGGAAAKVLGGPAVHPRPDELLVISRGVIDNPGLKAGA
jgi:hypothetical protein